MNANRVALYCVNPRLNQDIRSMLVSNYSIFGQEISQRAILIYSRGNVQWLFRDPSDI